MQIFCLTKKIRELNGVMHAFLESIFQTGSLKFQTNQILFLIRQNHNVPQIQHGDSGNIYLSKLDNRKARKRCEICLKLTVKTTGRHH